VDWNREVRRDTGMGQADLSGWFNELAALENPRRREFHLLTLLSGCRPAALKEVRLEHLDFRRRVLDIAKPKGGAERAFDIPLSRQMIQSLVRTLRLGRFMHPGLANEWLFPAHSASGHLSEKRKTGLNCQNGEMICGRFTGRLQLSRASQMSMPSL
jgi:integrase